MVWRLDYVCRSVLADYEGTGNDRDQKLLANIYVKENISCASKIELPYYSVDNYPKICIYCGLRARRAHSAIQRRPILSARRVRRNRMSKEERGSTN